MGLAGFGVYVAEDAHRQPQELVAALDPHLEVAVFQLGGGRHRLVGLGVVEQLLGVLLVEDQLQGLARERREVERLQQRVRLVEQVQLEVVDLEVALEVEGLTDLGGLGAGGGDQLVVERGQRVLVVGRAEADLGADRAIQRDVPDPFALGHVLGVFRCESDRLAPGLDPESGERRALSDRHGQLLDDPVAQPEQQEHREVQAEQCEHEADQERALVERVADRQSGVGQ